MEHLCSCRADCVEVGDCCLDFELPDSSYMYNYNTALETRLLVTAQTISEAALSQHIRCRPLPIFAEAVETEYIFEEKNYSVVSCGMAEVHDIPVCSHGFIFENLACAKQRVQELNKSIDKSNTYLWLEDFLCDESVIEPLEYIREYNFTYFVHLARKLCTTAYILPEECRNTSLRMRCLTDTWECRQEAEKNKLASPLYCLSHQDPVWVEGKLYHNQYCARCVNKKIPLGVECAALADTVGRGYQHFVSITGGTLRFSIMLDFDGSLHGVDLPAFGPTVSAGSSGEVRAETLLGLLCCSVLIQAMPLPI